MRFKRFLYIGIGIILAGCFSNSSDEQKVIRIGTSVGDFGTMARDFIAPELKKQGYTIKVTEFSDIMGPNIALNDGSIDINTFQHRFFLEGFNKSNNSNLLPIFQIPTGPLGLYSGRKQTLQEVEKGAVVAVPLDTTNYSRALILLQDLGWIKLSENVADPFSVSAKDIISNPHGIILKEIESPLIPRIRVDVDYAIITGNFAASSGIPFTEALFTDPHYNFINWAVIRPEDAESDWVKAITEAYHGAEYKAYIKEHFPGYKHPASWNSR